jgi:PhnB protein
MPAKPIPEGYHTATPYLIIQGAAQALDFYRAAFGAKEEFRFENEGVVAHAEIRIGDSVIMLGEEMPGMGYRGPRALGGTPVSIMLYVEDVDRLVRQAEAAGAQVVRPVKDQFYGDRSGTLTDPFGHVWTIATHREDVAPDELDRRFKQEMAGQSA